MSREQLIRDRLADKQASVRAYADEIGVGPRGSERICAGLEVMFMAVLDDGEASRSRTMRLPGLRSQPLWDDQRELFPEVAALEDNFEAILAEYRALRDAEALRRYTDASLVEAGTWGQLHLRVQGRVLDDNAAACPVTARLLLDGGHRVGVTYFSAHAEGTRVRGHHGPGNYRVRCHLGLEVPARCGMKVGELSFRWRAGRCSLLDDSFFHEVWNDGPGARVILLTDFWHPDLREEEIAVFERLMSDPSERANELERAVLASEQEVLPRGLWVG